MSNRAKNKPRFQIPETIDPPDRLCLSIEVPNDPTHIANILGALWQLCYAPAWETTGDDSAKRAAQVWRDSYYKLTLDNCPTPPPPIAPGGLMEDFEMPLRVDCDCNVFVTCCDGTEKQILTGDQVQALIDNNAQVGAPQPQPGGGCQTYSMSIPAAESRIVPVVVNSGDVITCRNFKGATSQVGGVGAWRCADGNLFVANTCYSGFIDHDAGNPVPSDPSGEVLVNINGTFYSALTPITVPPGIVNQQVAISLNYLAVPTPQGTMALDVQVCNNQASTWESVLDFTANPGPVDVLLDFGTWVTGVGYNGVLNGSVPNFVQLQISLDSCTITEMSMVYDDAGNGGGSIGIFFQANGSNYGTPATPNVGSSQLYDQVSTVGAVTVILLVLSSGTTGAATNVSKWSIKGTGTKPSQLP